MTLACVSTALLLLSTGAPAAARAQLPLQVYQAASPAKPADKPAAAADPARDERAIQATDYYSRGRFVEASLEFEGLWRDYPKEPRFLFNAAASRYAARHYAHTVAYLNEYLARSDVQGDDRKEAQVQLDEARNKVATVQVTVAVPGAAGDVRVTVRHVARGSSDLRPELPFTVRPSAGSGGVPVQLEPGDWVVRAEAQGYTPAEQRVTVTSAPRQRVDLKLAVAPVEAPVTGPSKASADMPGALRRKLTIGLVVGGAATAVAGLVVTTVGVVRRGQVESCTTSVGECKSDLKLGVRMRDAGAGVVGAGFGVMAAGAIWGSSFDAAKRRRAWIAEAAVGGVMVVGGYVGLMLASKPFNVANTAPLTLAMWPDHYSGKGNAIGHAATATIFGFGVGMLASSVASLVIQRKHSRPRSAALRSLQVDGAASPWMTGLTLSGRF